MPDTQVAELAERTRSSEDEAVRSRAAQDRAVRIGQRANLCLITLAREDKLNLTVALRVGLAASDDEDFVQILRGRAGGLVSCGRVEVELFTGKSISVLSEQG